MRQIFASVSSGLLLLLATVAGAATPRLASADAKGLAVVLIDMQYGFYERGGTTDTAELQELVAHQKVLLEWAVREDVPVLVFEYARYKATDKRLMDVLQGHPHVVVTKTSDGGFDREESRQSAMKALQEWKTDTLIVAGINGGYCVKSTALGAIQNGFDVMTSSDVVGNINQNPPLYPNDTWYFKDKKFVVFENLESIID